MTTTRNKATGLNWSISNAAIYAVRKIGGIGKIKEKRPIINVILKRSNIPYGYKDLIKECQTLLAEIHEGSKEKILEKWTYEENLKAVAPNILSNPRFQAIATETIAMGIFSPKEPSTFIAKYYSYTNSEGHPMVQAYEYNEDKAVFEGVFRFKKLTAKNAAAILEQSFNNFMRIRKNALLDKKSNKIGIYKVEDGQIFGHYAALVAEDGTIVRGEKIK